MRLISTAAMSLALAAMGGLAVTSPAVAQSKKEEAKAAPKIQASQAFFKEAKPVQEKITAKDYDGALALMPQAEAAATTPDDKYFVGNFYLNIGIGKSDIANQRKGVEMMLASGKVAEADLAANHMAAGNLAFDAKDMESARNHFNTAIQHGADASDLEALIAETYFTPAFAGATNAGFTPEGRALAVQGLPHLKKAIDAQIAKGTPPPVNWYQRGLQAAYLANSPDAFAWTELTLAQTNKPDDWSLAMRQLQAMHTDMPRGVSVDLLRLMYDTRALTADYNYAEFVDSLWRLGLPGEVKTVIDTASADGRIEKQRFAEVYKLATDAIPMDKGDLGSSATAAAAAPDGKKASRTADAYLAYGEYQKAIPLYKLALEKGGVDADEVNTRMGIALARGGDLAGAKAAFDAVKDTGARGKIASLWEIYVGQKSRAG